MSMLSIVVPIYKNEANIIPFYKDFCSNIAPYLDDYEIIMVNDDSPDGSWEIMTRLAEENPKVKLIKLMRNFGAISASFTGLQYVSGDCATIKAVDLQEPASLTLQMYEKWKQGAKSVIAIRDARNDPPISSAFSNLYYWLCRKMITDKMPKGGFDTYLIDRFVLDYIVHQNDKNAPITLQLLWMGCGSEYVHYVRQKREIGKSSWSFAKKLKLFVDSFIGFSYVPIRIMTAAGIIFSVVSVLYAIYMIIARLMGGIDVRGYTTIIVLIAFSAGIIMFSLGVLGEYVWRTLDAARNRPISIVEEQRNFDKMKHV